jgi:hypothetical protein
MTLQEKKSRMAAIVSDWQASGMSQVEYARVHNFRISNLRYWVSRQRSKAEDGKGFMQLTPDSWVKPQESQNIRIRYPHGVELLLPANSPMNLIRELIRG